ncbi:tRNA-modifying protein YgfZ [Litorilituus lipolyticus]|uniref:tRNA-modifying protein YgfZ n=1 Tax=Litorilituus lipolyticus TaxID=2491017 RepID=A0A502KY12_9GAMM|nr:tRNA-modifying protein YgfZ [Litorilituus lipolyticus]TPH16558.1 tRNA-modifying protein YgfZ [Litorilituus lipolyticus]
MPLATISELPSLDQLPNNYLISLDNYSAISLSGEEQTKYLQGQVTCDATQTTDNSLQIGAHCDAKGKVFSVFRLINRLSTHLLLQPKDSLEVSLKELKKFGVFSKVTIEATDHLAFMALVGSDASELLSQHFPQIPDSLNQVVQHNSTTLVYLSSNQGCYLILDEKQSIATLAAQFQLPIYHNAVWNLLEINQGFPLLSKEALNHYVPQMLNLQALNGISFTKGCYLGQETVARMQYLGKNKRALFTLEGKSSSPISPEDTLEKQLGENWRKAGDIIAYYQADNGSCYLQAVLSNDEEASILRLKLQPNSIFELKELPYSLTTESD